MIEQGTHADRSVSYYLTKARRRLATEATRVLFQRPLTVRSAHPLISFTFDDFPKSAFVEAGSILSRYGAAGTYYASLGLMGKQSQMGPMYESGDLKDLVQRGHELGCHTFAHCHSWNTPPDEYENSIFRNQQSLAEILPGRSFETFAYPYSAPRLVVKRVASRHFRCCRGGGLRPGRYLHRHAAGGQTFNSGVTDLNYLCAFFLEQSRDKPEVVKRMIDQNALARGWLIFATHDVCAAPSPFGCTSGFFDQVVQWSVDSGAQILPVIKALDLIQGSSSN